MRPLLFGGDVHCYRPLRPRHTNSGDLSLSQPQDQGSQAQLYINILSLYISVFVLQFDQM